MSRPSVKIGLLGLGTVGSSVFRVLQANAADIASRAGAEIEIVKILVRDPAKPRPVLLPPDVLTTTPEAILDNPEIQVVVEVMGGLEPARGFILRALRNGKHVVTANKEVMAEYGKEIFHEAEAHRCSVYFEASVGGGIPIIRALKESLGANRIRSILGIINGTTNYILTRMTEEGASYEDVLADAQRLGYAEADPTADVGGHDAASKCAILASLAFDTAVHGEDVYREGIDKVTATDLRVADRLGYVVKLVGIASEVEDRVGVRVHPVFLPKEHPLASVREAFNAVYVEAEAAGELMFYGRGAGSLPTASAVVGDVIDVSRNLLQTARGAAESIHRAKPLRPIEDLQTQYYVLLDVDDQPGVLARLGELLGGAGINIEAISAFTGQGKGIVHLLVDRAEEALEVLQGAGVDVRAARDVVVKPLPDEPGQLGAACRKLADADVNIEQAYIAAGSMLVVVTDEVDRAKEVLELS